jgi:putative Mg2+ transporter-C (MgtC) family protein
MKISALHYACGCSIQESQRYNRLMVNLGTWDELALRLGSAMLVGGAIGWNREASHKAAGLRTHMLVSLGSALFMIVPIALGGSADAIARTIQGVATGIGFVGAGEILRTQRKSGLPEIQGLTSAAAIWVTSALGVLCACGFWQLSLIGVGLALFILVVAKWMEDHLFKSKQE